MHTQGGGYDAPPFVLLDGVPNKARAVLSGQVVERYTVDTNTVFPRTPVVEVTSGRNADVRAIVTGGKVTSLQLLITLVSIILLLQQLELEIQMEKVDLRLSMLLSMAMERLLILRKLTKVVSTLKKQLL